jgi:hypothetical protein
MVDLAEIQIAYYMVAATGVLVAAIFYILNMRETMRNRRATLTQGILDTFASVEGFKQFMMLFNMEWTDFDDFKKKYDSTVNPENAAIRHHFWNAYEVLGHQWKQGILDKETVYTVLTVSYVAMWAKFKPIIEEYRRTEIGEDAFTNWEMLAEEFAKMRAAKAPSFKGAGIVKPEEYEKTYGGRKL